MKHFGRKFLLLVAGIVPLAASAQVIPTTTSLAFSPTSASYGTAITGTITVSTATYTITHSAEAHLLGFRFPSSGSAWWIFWESHSL